MASLSVSPRIIMACCLAICVEVTAQHKETRQVEKDLLNNRLKASRTHSMHQDNTVQDIKCVPCSEMTIKVCQVKTDVTTLSDTV